MGGGNYNGPNGKPNVLLVVLDCLRRDSWKKDMPLSRKATKGWFHLENHRAVAHCSDPNHAALFTGYGPWETNITTQMGVQYKETLPTLFWRWKRDIGGTTWAVQPIGVPKFYRYSLDWCAHQSDTDSSDLEMRAIRKFIGKTEAGKPWLGFLRSMTCHYPYLDLPSPPRASGNMSEQYQAAVQHEDEFINNLVEYVLSEYPDTIILICADHGELLGEHGEWDHLYTLYSILTWVPMAVYIPGLKGKKTNRPTQHVDVLPTLCDFLGLDRQGEGVSWANWMNDYDAHPSPSDRIMWLQGTGAGPSFEEQQDHSHSIDPGIARVLWRHRGVICGPFKAVENLHARGELSQQFTKSGDFKERKEMKRAARLVEHLPPFPAYHAWEKKLVYGETEKSDEEIILERLRALGYA